MNAYHAPAGTVWELKWRGDRTYIMYLLSDHVQLRNEVRRVFIDLSTGCLDSFAKESPMGCESEEIE